MSVTTLAPSPFFDSAAPLAHTHLLPTRKNTVSFSEFHFSSPDVNVGLFR